MEKMSNCLPMPTLKEQSAVSETNKPYQRACMSKIAISYRREDSMDITGRIFDRLVGRYGREAVFRDIDNISPGRDFRKHLKRIIGDADILIVVVGPNWMGEDQQGHPRILTETDFVRTELEIALTHGITLIPLVVGDASMPDPSVLPESIKEFAYRNAFTIDSGRDFDHHINGLIEAVDKILPPPKKSTSLKDESKFARIGSDRNAPRSGLFFPMVGGVMTVLGIMHIGWFIQNLTSAFSAGAAGHIFMNVWSYADIAFGLGGVFVGIATIYARYWARFGGIILCLLASFSNSLWFIDNFDKGLPRLMLTGTAFATLLFILGIYLYLYKWPHGRPHSSSSLNS